MINYKIKIKTNSFYIQKKIFSNKNFTFYLKLKKNEYLFKFKTPMIPQNVCPLLVFVNVKSGGQQGADLITSFRHLLNPHQVFDLQNGGPLPGYLHLNNILI